MDFLDKSKLYVILFSSNDLISSTIKCFDSFFLRRKCIFSHSGILFHSNFLSPEFKFYICNPGDSFLVLESTLSGELNDGVYDTCKKVKFGVQVRFLNELVESYSGRRIAVSEVADDISSAKFSEILRMYIDRKYEKYITNLITIHLPIPSINSKTLFCSELVYRVLKELGVRVSHKNPKKVSPNSLRQYVNLKELIYIVVP
jgi:hypothetical protein